MYAIVSNEEEVVILKRLFPKLNETDISVRQDTHFDIQLGFMTQGLFPEVIINTLEEEKLLSVINCFTNYGRIFHFGKEDLKKNVQLGMSIFLLSTSFYAMSPGILTRLPFEEKEELRAFISRGITDGVVRPLPRIVYSTKDVEKIKSVKEIEQNRKKILLTPETLQIDSDRLQINGENSYVIIGDEKDVWIDVAEWLLRRGALKLVINLENPANVQKHPRRVQKIKEFQNVIFRKNSTLTNLLIDAQKAGEVAAVFLVAMGKTNSKKMSDLDQNYKDPKGHLIVISQKKDGISEICKTRTSNGYLSTNFIWEAEDMLISRSLNFMEKLFGRDPIIHVADNKKSLDLTQNANRMLTEILPSSVEEFCKLGSTLDQDVHLYELPTKGLSKTEVKELSPLIVIPGLQTDARSSVLQFSKGLMYPMVCVQLPNLQMTVEELASFILPVSHFL